MPFTQQEELFIAVCLAKEYKIAKDTPGNTLTIEDYLDTLYTTEMKSAFAKEIIGQ